MTDGPADSLLYWPDDELNLALESLLTAGGYALGTAVFSEAPLVDIELLDWAVNAARPIGLEGSLRMVEKGQLLSLLFEPGPHWLSITVRLGQKSQARTVMIVSSGITCRVVCRQGMEWRCRTIELVDRVLLSVDDGGAVLERLFAPMKGGNAVLKRLTARERLERLPISVISYRPDAASTMGTLLSHQGANRDAVAFTVATIVQLAIVSFAAFTLGSAALDGLVDTGRVIAWAMISVVTVPIVYFASMKLSRLSLAVGAAIKRRMLEGTFFLDEDVLRREGYSSHLARVNESSVLERLSIGEAFGLLSPILMIGIASYIFLSAPSGWQLAALELIVLAIGAYFIAKLSRFQFAAYAERTALTSEVVDKVLGHRTRAVQEHPHLRHQSEDRKLSAYVSTLARLDSAGNALTMLPSLWTFTAAAILSVSFINSRVNEDFFASGVAVVLVALALSSLSTVAERLTTLVTAWRAVRALFVAGRQRTRPERVLQSADDRTEWPVVLATSSLSYSYRLGARSVLADASLRVRKGERLLLEGPSGGGKTTFVKVVAGELRPGGGSVLVSGLDPFSGSESQWRKLVASVPQFHENHIFSQTFAFNVDPQSVRLGLTDEARQICEELDLGHVLQKMPAGSAQLLGETGWQLSHGERSRVFIARALLQKAQLVILDESFAALDPITMKIVVDCVRRRAPTLLVIAHV